jgi:hypothetical protein
MFAMSAQRQDRTRRTTRARVAPTVVSLTVVIAGLLVAGGPDASARTGAAPPSVSALTVHSGWYGGGTRLTIQGSNFVHVIRVKFGTVAGKSLHVISSKSLQVTTPAHAVGRSDVRVVTAAGTSPAAAQDRFRFVGWALTKVPLPPAAYAGNNAGDLNMSACWGEDECAAAGNFTDTSGNSQAALWRLSGRAWSVIRAPLPADAADNPNALPVQISCGTSGVCAVTGRYKAHVNGSDTGRYVMWTLSAAGHWTQQILPLPADATPGSGGFNILGKAVSCGGAQCAAMGSYTFSNSSAGSGAVLWTLTGATWTATEAPLPADAAKAPFAQILNLACEPAGTCAAIGTYSDGHTGKGALWTWAGNTWTVTEAVAPSDLLLGFSTNGAPLSCGKGGVCAGALQTGFPDSDQLWTLSGGHWSQLTLPTPAGADTSKRVSVNAISCTSGGLCTAAGQYTDKNGNQQASLWARSSAGSWTASKAPLPADAAANPAPGVRLMSCGGSGVCLVSGPYTAHANGSDLSEIAMWMYRSGTWSLVPALVPHQQSVTALACNTSYCAAHVTGFTSTTQESYTSRTFALLGRAWHTAALPLPSNAKTGLTEAYSFASESYAGGVLNTYYSDPNSNNRDAAWVYIS